MPATKGKRHKGSRKRGTLGTDPSNATAAGTSTPGRTSGSRPAPVRRRRRTTPPWANLTIGISLVAVGLFFAVFPFKGETTASRLIFLLLYFALAGFYLGRAILQYRGKLPRA